MGKELNTTASSGGKGTSTVKANNNRRNIIRKRAKLAHPFDTLPLRYKVYHMLDIEGLPNVDVPPFMAQVKTLTYRFMSLVTVLMTICIVLWSLPRYTERGNEVFEIFILICVLIFTIDWVLRMVCSPSVWRSLLSPLNMIDIVSLLLFWIDYADILPQGIVHWVLLLRIFRLIRSLLALKQYAIVIKTIEESTEVAALMGMIFAIGLPTVGTAIYYAERGTYSDDRGRWERNCRLDDNCTMEVSPFQDAVQGMWFAAFTLTTLGLGDVYPVTDIGYIVGGLTMIVAVFMIAIPIMILVVNFETEKENVEREHLRQQARMGKYLQELQKEHMKLEDEESVQKAAQHRAVMSSILDEDTMTLTAAAANNPSGFKPRSVYYRVNDKDIYRRAILYSDEEVRYLPILALMRDPLDPNLVFLGHNPKKTPYRFKLKIALGTRETETAARRAMNSILPTTCMKVTKARHFNVLSMHFALLKPENQCEFLRNVRLLKAYEDNINPDQNSVTAVLELENLKCDMDQQRVRDFGYALQRCRLRVTASVVYHNPITYEVPIFVDMLRATNLIKELTARPKGLTYCTRDQLYDLVNGIHHLIDLKDPVTEDRFVVTNSEQINVAVVNAIISGYSMLLPDVFATKPNDFLFPSMRDAAIAHINDTNPNKKVQEFYGIFTNRLARRPEERGWLNIFLGKDTMFAPESEENSRDTKVLCHVNVTCVVPSVQTTTMSFQCSSASPVAEKNRSYADDAGD